MTRTLNNVIIFNDPNSVELGQSWKSVILQHIFAFWGVIPNELDTRYALIWSSMDICIEQKTIETLISILKTAKPKRQIYNSFEKHGLVWERKHTQAWWFSANIIKEAFTDDQFIYNIRWKR